MATINDRTTAWSDQLAQAHNTLRSQLRHLRSALGSTEVARMDLLSHCVAFCSALTAHHVGEDNGMFAELLRARPALKPVVANLVQDHEMIGAILQSVRDLSTEAVSATSGRLEAIGRELDGLAAILESHFGYEERAISGALDVGVRDTGWTKPVFRFTEL